MMCWLSLLLLSSISFAQTQDIENCNLQLYTCVLYAYCQNVSQQASGQCAYHNEVCCILDDPGTDVESTTVPRTDLKPTPVPRTSELNICGMRNKKTSGSSFIWKVINPDPEDALTNENEYPWMVALLKGTEFLGGGSIIYPNVILTTAHKLDNVLAGDLLVKAGVWNTTDISEIVRHQDRSVMQIVLHPGFNKDKVANDFALLILTDPLTITDSVAPICVPASTRPINESSCIATGWGAANYGNTSVASVLKKVSLPLVEFEECQRKLREHPDLGRSYKLHNSFLCAGGGEADTCTGDGGGPLMCATLDDPNRYVQIGITSWGMGCGNSFPGVYAKVEAVTEWIERQADRFPNVDPKRMSA